MRYSNYIQYDTLRMCSPPLHKRCIFFMKNETMKRYNDTNFTTIITIARHTISSENTQYNQCIYNHEVIYTHHSTCNKQYSHNLHPVVPEGQSKVRGRRMKLKEECELS